MNINREIYIQEIVDGFAYNQIVVLQGARQVGKTTLMELYTKNKEAVWLNGQNRDISEIFERFSLIENFQPIRIGKQLEGMLIIDKFQYIPDISTRLKLLVDQYKSLKILCSCSSSLDILQSVKESLVGRVRIINVYSFSFPEFVKFKDEALYFFMKNCKATDDLLKLFPNLGAFLNEYLIYGGLPKIVLASPHSRKIELLNIYQTDLLQDVKQYIKNKDFVAFNKLLKLLSSQIGNLLKVSELSNTLQLPSCSRRVCLYS